jgi:hypothetical protein
MEYIIFYFEKYNTYYPFRFVLQIFSHQVKKKLPSNIQIALVSFPTSAAVPQANPVPPPPSRAPPLVRALDLHLHLHPRPTPTSRRPPMVAEQVHASQRIGDDEMQKATAVSQRIPSTSCRSLRARRPRLGQMEEARARGAPWVFRRKMSCAGQAIA